MSYTIFPGFLTNKESSPLTSFLFVWLGSTFQILASPHPHKFSLSPCPFLAPQALAITKWRYLPSTLWQGSALVTTGAGFPPPSLPPPQNPSIHSPHPLTVSTWSSFATVGKSSTSSKKAWFPTARALISPCQSWPGSAPACPAAPCHPGNWVD